MSRALRVATLGLATTVCLAATDARQPPAGGPAGRGHETFVAPTFGEVAIHANSSIPRRVVLLLSGDDGWSTAMTHLADMLAASDAMVVGIDAPRFTRALDRRASCPYPAGDLEELSRSVQLRYGVPAYRRPIIVGVGSGAALAYAALAAAPPETFAGGIGLAFCPRLIFARRPCQTRLLVATRRPGGKGFVLGPSASLGVPWRLLQPDGNGTCDAAAVRAFAPAGSLARLEVVPGAGAFDAPAWMAALERTFRSLASDTTPAAPVVSVPAVADLEPIEVAAGVAGGDTMAVLVSGDGGWADIDKALASGLATRGIPVVGISSLAYFWTPRTPDGVARDLGRLIEHYAAAWKRRRVILVGYSFGADVLPFVVSRLPEATRDRIVRLGLLGLSDTASFEFHVSSWLGGGADPALRTVPEIQRLAVPVTCVAGADETDSACRALTGGNVRSAVIGRGHHFSGLYDQIVDVLVR